MRNLPQGYTFVRTDTVLRITPDKTGTFYVSDAQARHMAHKTNTADRLEVLANTTLARVQTSPPLLPDGSTPKVTLREFKPGNKPRVQLVVRDAGDNPVASVSLRYESKGYRVEARSSNQDLAEALRDRAMYE